MNSISILFIVAAVLSGVLTGMLLGAVSQDKATRRNMQLEAVKNNCGYYEVDQKTGEVQFRWREFPPRTMIMKQGGVVEVPNE